MSSAYSLGIYEKALPASLAWKEKFRAAGEVGYDYFELSVDESDARLARLDLSRKERAELASLALCEGVPFRSMCLSAQRKYPFGSEDRTTEQRAMEIARKAIELASDLGIRTVMLAGYDVYYEPSTEKTVARFEKNLAIATEWAASEGVILAFETMETPFMNTTEKAMKYVKEIASPYLMVYPDVGNVTNAFDGSAIRAKADLESGEGHIVSVHLKETCPGVFRDMSFGTGHVDFDLMTATAWKLGVRRFVTEYWDHSESDWKDRLSSMVAFSRTRLDALSKGA